MDDLLSEWCWVPPYFVGCGLWFFFFFFSFLLMGGSQNVALHALRGLVSCGLVWYGLVWYGLVGHVGSWDQMREGKGVFLAALVCSRSILILLCYLTSTTSAAVTAERCAIHNDDENYGSQGDESKVENREYSVVEVASGSGWDGIQMSHSNQLDFFINLLMAGVGFFFFFHFFFFSFPSFPSFPLVCACAHVRVRVYMPMYVCVYVCECVEIPLHGVRRGIHFSFRS